MRFLPLAIVLLTAPLGLYLFVYTYRTIKHLTTKYLPIKDLVTNSVLAGLAGFLVFFSLIIAMGIWDTTYMWTADKLYNAMFVSLIPAGLIFAGSLVQSILMVGYKRILLDLLNKKDE